MKSAHFNIEEEYWKKGYTVLGIDEVGRGCLAGPITVGMTCFSPTLSSTEKNKILKYGITDSKKLSAKKREKLVPIIQKHTLYYDTTSSSVEIINQSGIEFALKNAIAQLAKKYRLEYPDKKFLLLVDGRTISNIPYINDIERIHIIGGDSISISIAAASILAKVQRDKYMETLSGQELYGWAQNKGYGTRKHCEAIKQYGLTEQHRQLFVRNILSAAQRV